MKRPRAHRMTHPLVLAVGVHVAVGLGLAELNPGEPQADGFVVMSIASASPTPPTKKLVEPATRRTRFAARLRRASPVATSSPEPSDELETDDVTLPSDSSLGEFIDFDAAFAESRSPRIVGATQPTLDIDATTAVLHRLAVLRHNWNHNRAVSGCLNKKLSVAHVLVRQATTKILEARRIAEELRRLGVTPRDLDKLYTSARHCLPL